MTMPSRAPRVCGHCGGAHAIGERCAAATAHDKERKARFDRKRPNASRRGYDREWEGAAKAFLAEPGNECCARCGRPAVVVMHRISIRKRPDLRMERANWRPGCHRCNAIEAVHERRNTKGPRP
jgi:5-methylcytosine-specific restriction endonuclease McrA